MARFIAEGEPDSVSSLASIDDIPDLEYKDIVEKVFFYFVDLIYVNYLLKC